MYRYWLQRSGSVSEHELEVPGFHAWASPSYGREFIRRFDSCGVPFHLRLIYWVVQKDESAAISGGPQYAADSHRITIRKNRDLVSCFSIAIEKIAIPLLTRNKAQRTLEIA